MPQCQALAECEYGLAVAWDGLAGSPETFPPDQGLPADSDVDSGIIEGPSQKGGNWGVGSIE